MYSPAIHSSLIPVLYRLGRQRRQPMTVVASTLILDALERTELPPAERDGLESARRILSPFEPLQEAA